MASDPTFCQPTRNDIKRTFSGQTKPTPNANPQYTVHCSPESDERKAYVQEIAQEIHQTLKPREDRGQIGQSQGRQKPKGGRENTAQDSRSIAAGGIQTVKVVDNRSEW
jgi:hypothetical protein